MLASDERRESLILFVSHERTLTCKFSDELRVLRSLISVRVATRNFTYFHERVTRRWTVSPPLSNEYYSRASSREPAMAGCKPAIGSVQTATIWRQCRLGCSTDGKGPKNMIFSNLKIFSPAPHFHIFKIFSKWANPTIVIFFRKVQIPRMLIFLEMSRLCKSMIIVIFGKCQDCDNLVNPQFLTIMKITIPDDRVKCVNPQIS